MSTLKSFFHVIYPFSLSIMFFLFPYFTPELFCFHCIQLLVCPCAFSINLSVEFSFIMLEGPVLFVLFNSVQVSFEFLFFHQYFLIPFLLVVLSDLSTILFWHFHSNVYLHTFLSLVLLLVVIVSLSVILA